MARLAEPARWARWVFGASLATMGLVDLVLGRFDPIEPVPRSLSGQSGLAITAALVVLALGAMILFRPTMRAAAVGLCAYFGLLVAGLMNGARILLSPQIYGVYSGAAEPLALAAAALVLTVRAKRDDRPDPSRAPALGRLVFGGCLLLFGGAHFAYLELTAPLVPSWAPPSQTFWAYATGAADIAAGLALIGGVQARLAARLVTVMFAAFTPLVHLPRLVADPGHAYYWTETALNLALTGAAWVVAESIDTQPSKAT